MGIRKSDFVTKTQFLYNTMSIYFVPEIRELQRSIET